MTSISRWMFHPHFNIISHQQQCVLTIFHISKTFWGQFQPLGSCTDAIQHQSIALHHFLSIFDIHLSPLCTEELCLIHVNIWRHEVRLTSPSSKTQFSTAWCGHYLFKTGIRTIALCMSTTAPTNAILQETLISLAAESRPPLSYWSQYGQLHAKSIDGQQRKLNGLTKPIGSRQPETDPNRLFASTQLIFKGLIHGSLSHWEKVTYDHIKADCSLINETGY